MLGVAFFWEFTLRFPPFPLVELSPVHLTEVVRYAVVIQPCRLSCHTCTISPNTWGRALSRCALQICRQHPCCSYRCGLRWSRFSSVVLPPCSLLRRLYGTATWSVRFFGQWKPCFPIREVGSVVLCCSRLSPHKVLAFEILICYRFQRRIVLQPSGIADTCPRTCSRQPGRSDRARYFSRSTSCIPLVTVADFSACWRRSLARLMSSFLAYRGGAMSLSVTR